MFVLLGNKYNNLRVNIVDQCFLISCIIYSFKNYLYFSGSIPGPVLYGTVFDQACLVTQERCSVKGSCWIYDRWKMALYLMLIGISLRTCTGILFFLAHLCYKPPPDKPLTMEVTVNGNTVSESVDTKAKKMVSITDQNDSTHL